MKESRLPNLRGLRSSRDLYEFLLTAVAQVLPSLIGVNYLLLPHLGVLGRQHHGLHQEMSQSEPGMRQAFLVRVKLALLLSSFAMLTRPACLHSKQESPESLETSGWALQATPGSLLHM